MGFEAEFDEGADRVIGALYDAGLADTRTLHPYHCDCEDCEIGEAVRFRGQRDSSCSGEVISDILDPDTLPLFALAIAKAAQDTDAEPGLASGCHVHVGTAGLTSAELNRSFWQFIRWENVLCDEVATGRFQEQRRSNNAVRPMLRYTLIDQCYEYEVPVPDLYRRERQGLEEIVRGIEPHVTPTMLRGFRQAHYENDRHSNLNLHTSHPTWEFRLWNSTRSAWRVQMYCLVSSAWMDPDFIARIGNVEPNADVLCELLDASDHTRAAELVERQLAYRSSRDGRFPTLFVA